MTRIGLHSLLSLTTAGVTEGEYGWSANYWAIVSLQHHLL